MLGCCTAPEAAGPPAVVHPGHRVAESSSLPEGGRLHVTVQGRYISILRLQGELRAIDSVCFHAGGPLGIGDIEELNGRACIICPWHYYKVDLQTGDKYYQQVDFRNGKMVPGEWTSNGVKQRVHKAEEHEGHIYVELQLDGKVESDDYACKPECGARLVSAGGKKVHSSGADGRLPSGQVFQQGAGAAGSRLSR